MLGCCPGVAGSVGLGQGLMMCISNMFPSAAAAGVDQQTRPTLLRHPLVPSCSGSRDCRDEGGNVDSPALAAKFSLGLGPHGGTYQECRRQSIRLAREVLQRTLLLPARFLNSAFHDSGQLPNSGWKVQVPSYHLLSMAK